MAKPVNGIRVGMYLNPITVAMIDKLANNGVLSDSSLVTSRRTVIERLVGSEFNKQGLSLQDLELKQDK